MTQAQYAIYRLALTGADVGLIMSASELAQVLNRSGIRNADGGEYSTEVSKARGVHALVATTYRLVEAHVSPADAAKRHS